MSILQPITLDSLPSCQSPPILTTIFHLKPGGVDTVFSLHQKYILQYEVGGQNQGELGSPVARILFTEDLFFSMVRDTSESGIPGKFLGICFERENQELTLHCRQKRKLKHWYEVLRAKLNQTGFHKLYKPIKKIGKGNFATVYLALRMQDDRKFAVKAFSKEYSFAQEDGKAALLNEIKIMRMLNHGNLLQLFQVFQSESSVYLCLELVQGGQLFDLVKSKYKFRHCEIISLMRGLISGLEHLHAKRIMHRDLKPENILMRSGGRFECVIADFGLSAWTDEKQHLYVRCGTPGYVAPEIVNARDVTMHFQPVCDMFSVGVIFHIMVMGKSPFSGKTYNEVLTQNRLCNISFEGFEYSRLSEVTLDLLKRLLDKNPSTRITAEQALKHQYLSRQFELSSIEQQIESPHPTKMIVRPTLGCHSPLMTSCNSQRKKDNLFPDSLPKFKMQQNVMTGKTDTTQSLDSQRRCHTPNLPPRQSKFAKRTIRIEQTTNHNTTQDRQ